MKPLSQHISYSKLIHILTLICFLLPFFYNSCNSISGFSPSAKEKEAMEKARMDSITAVDSIRNTNPNPYANNDVAKSSIARKDSSSVVTKQTPSEREEVNSVLSTKEEPTLSERLSKNFKYLRPFLNPRENTRSGAGMIVDSIPYISMFSIFIAFLLLTISLLIKFIEKTAYKTIILLDSLAFIALLISQPVFGAYERLWGFWVATIVAFILTLFDVYSGTLNKLKLNKD